VCVCPANKPNWSGSFCFVKEIICTGGRFYNKQTKSCSCPSSKPVWTGQNCIPRPVTCTGGRFPNNKGQCVCPSNLPIWTGQICIPKINICSGGRVFSLKYKKCVCPSNKPVWTGQNCISRTSCSGGKYYDNKKKTCVCPKNKPFWNGSSCTQYTTNPGFPKPPPGSEISPGPSQPSCSGGRYRNNKGQCQCPASKPMWINNQCVSIKLKGPVLKFPGIKIQ
jgi:hypothetical protein